MGPELVAWAPLAAWALSPSKGDLSHQERGCDRCNSFPATSKAQAVGGSRCKTDWGAYRFSHNPLGLRATRSQLGAVADQLHGDIGDVEAGGSYACSSLGQKSGARGIGPLRIGGPVVATQITQASRTQQRITCRMCNDITIRVAVGAYLVVKEETSHVHRTASSQPMNVDTDSGTPKGCL
jgi:hypothetical protein